MDNDPRTELLAELIKSRQLARPAAIVAAIHFLDFQRNTGLIWSIHSLFLKTIHHHPFCLFDFIQQLMCPDLSHPISLIGGIIPHLSNTALFHLWGHIDVNPHLGITTQEAARQNINVKKFDAVRSCLLCVIALQRSLCHMVCLWGEKTYPLAF